MLSFHLACGPCLCSVAREARSFPHTVQSALLLRIRPLAVSSSTREVQTIDPTLDVTRMTCEQPGPEQRLCLGIDGGGTSTICVAYDAETRRELGRSVSGSSNWNSVGTEQALQAVRESIDGALESSGLTLEQAGALCLCMSGVDSRADADRLSGLVQEWLPHTAAIRVENDALGALSGGTGGRLSGAVLIAGTGTIAFARTADGRECRSSGWGPAFLDPGSGYDIGQRGLAAAARAADGRGPSTSMVQALCQACGVAKPQDLIRWAYASTSWERISSLAPAVLQAAEQQDQAALGIQRAVVPALVDSVEAVVKQAQLGSPFDVVLAGGLLTQSSWYAQLVADEIRARLGPGAHLIFQQANNAALGAALIASMHLGQGHLTAPA